jgi:hypothetical protein
MLYLRNTNQIQSLAQQVERGPAPLPPPDTTYYNGLGRQVWSKGLNNLTSSAYFTYTPQSGSTIADCGSLTIPFLPNTGSAQWEGYFKASTTELYAFSASADDAVWLWMGNEATASNPATSSALLGAPRVLGGRTTYSGSISLTAGTYYPMRWQYSGVFNPDYLTASFETPTISNTEDFTGYTFCSTASLGF